jgi:GNAT superfamily N-acetyltransferase
MHDLIIKKISIEYLDQIVKLTQYLNPDIEINLLRTRQFEMFQFDNFICFGLFNKNELLGVSGGWVTVRLYSGKQIEIDNLIINPQFQSQGYGDSFLHLIQNWAIENNCKTIELNTYVQNSRSHKFYFNKNFKILGFHFQKEIC